MKTKAVRVSDTFWFEIKTSATLAEIHTRMSNKVGAEVFLEDIRIVTEPAPEPIAIVFTSNWSVRFQDIHRVSLLPAEGEFLNRLVVATQKNGFIATGDEVNEVIDQLTQHGWFNRYSAEKFMRRFEQMGKN